MTIIERIYSYLSYFIAASPSRDNLVYCPLFTEPSSPSPRSVRLSEHRNQLFQYNTVGSLSSLAETHNATSKTNNQSRGGSNPNFKHTKYDSDCVITREKPFANKNKTPAWLFNNRNYSICQPHSPAQLRLGIHRQSLTVC